MMIYTCWLDIQLLAATISFVFSGPREFGSAANGVGELCNLGLICVKVSHGWQLKHITGNGNCLSTDPNITWFAILSAL